MKNKRYFDNFNIPQSNTTYAFAIISIVLFFISLRWMFSFPDPSQFLIFLLFSAIFSIIAYLVEKTHLNSKKLLHLEKRLDSHVYPVGGSE